MPTASLWRTPAVRTFLIFAAMLSACILYGRAFFYRDPLSIFFDPDRGFDRGYSKYRAREARAFLEGLNSDYDILSGSSPGFQAYSDSDSGQPSTSNALDSHRSRSRNITKSSPTPKICASISTVRRPGKQYIEEALGSLLAGLRPHERRELYLHVFFAGTQPGSHPTFNAPWLREVADNVSSYDSLDADGLAWVSKLEAKEDWKTKSLFDYTYALQRCLATGAPFVLMLEGDVLLAEGWLARVLLHGIRGARQALKMDTSDWLYLRLFNQERSTGWKTTRVGGNHEFRISLSLAAVLAGAALLLRKVAPATRAWLDNGSLLVLCFLAVPAFVVLFYQAGKASVLPPKPGVWRENFGCCSQALLYPREQVAELVRSLRNQHVDHYDLMVNRHAKNAGLDRLALYPVSAQHVGRQSVRGTDQDESIATWSAAFESLDPETLRREHRGMLEELYGKVE